MKDILIVNLFKKWKKYLNKIISVNGWIKTKRYFKKNKIFIDINDGSCLKCLQIIFEINDNVNKKIININSGFSINVIGLVILSKGKKQFIEILSKNIKILGDIKNQNKYPLSPKNHSFEYLREITHLRPKTYFFSSVSRIRNSIFYKIHNFMNKNNFIWIPTPIITSFDTEESSKMFIVESEDSIKNKNHFFNKKAFLTVSGQINIESYACSMSKVYSFGPVFRAENSNTRKHLAEFWMLEPEISFFNFKKIIKFSEKFIKKILKFIIINNLNDIEYINKKLNKNTLLLINNCIKNNFIILTYKEIINILNKNNNFNIKWGENINSIHEKFLLKLFNLPIFLINFPFNLKPFYMKLNKDDKTVLSMDLIFPTIGEIIGGSERENRIDILKKNMKFKNIKNNWYIDLRRYGNVPHSGFGMGLERLILLITGINNIRDVSAFPRSPGKMNF